MDEIGPHSATGSSVAALIAALRDSDEKIRNAAAHELRQRKNDPDVLELLMAEVSKPAEESIPAAPTVEPEGSFGSDETETLPIATRRLELVKVCLAWPECAPASTRALLAKLEERMGAGFECDVKTVRNDLTNLSERLGGPQPLLSSPGAPHPCRFTPKAARLTLAQMRLEQIVLAYKQKKVKLSDICSLLFCVCRV